MSRELIKIKCFNAKQLEAAKLEHKSYTLVPVNKNGYKFIIMECWEETESLFSSNSNEAKTAAPEEQYY